MGRPLQPPKIKPLESKDENEQSVGVRGYLVTATVAGKQLKKIVPTRDAANLLVSKWRDARKAAYQFLPTTMTSTQLRDAEAAQPFWDTLGLSATAAAAWMVKNYEKPEAYRWTDLIEEFRQSRRHKHHLRDGDPDTNHILNLVAAARGFADYTKRVQVGTPTLPEVEGWLAGRGGFNQLLGDIRSFFIWCIKRGKLKDDPTAAIDRQTSKRRKLPTTQAPDASANMMLTLEVQAPEWVPYAAMCLFAFMRPWTREGESVRLDQDLRLGKQVLFPAGVMLHGKNGSARIVPWKLVVESDRQIEVPFRDTDKSKLLRTLAKLARELPAEVLTKSDGLAKPGAACATCNFRHRCGTYQRVASSWWNLAPSWPLPRDLWGKIIRVVEETNQTYSILVEDAAGRVTRVDRLSKARWNSPPSAGSRIWLFNLESPISRSKAVNARLHPNFFYECPADTTQVRAWSAQLFVAP